MSRRPAASPWPFLVALSLGVLAVAVVWGANERGNIFAGLLLALTVAATATAAGGWVWETIRPGRTQETDNE